VDLYLDLETYSATPIRAGTYRYAADCEPMLIGYAINDFAAKVWDRVNDPEMPLDLYDAIVNAERVIAHNAQFDRTALRLGDMKLEIPLLKWRCTMAQALAHSLPGGLELLCEILGVEGKMTEGKELVRLFCQPRPKNSALRRATRATHPEEWRKFVEYCARDTEACRTIHKKMPQWNYEKNARELSLCHLDWAINDRGVFVDQEFSQAALETTERVQKTLAAEMTESTQGEVDAATQRDKLLQHILKAHGVSLPDMKAATLERRLDDPDLPEPVRELIINRLEASLTSPKKHKKLLAAVSEDGRLRGLLQWCGAARTGRWSGRLFQPQNLARIPKYLQGDEYENAIEAIKGGAAELLYSNPLEVISGTVRGALVAAPGKKLVAGDLKAIEGCITPWYAGEEWRLEALRNKEDLYVQGYARSFGISPADVTPEQRQVGKVQELAFNFGGAVGAFAKMAGGLDLPEEQVVAIVKAWRKANPNIVKMWYHTERTVKDAINNPGVEYSICGGRAQVRRDKNWLRIRLPSGRYLCYPNVRIVDNEICYNGINQYTRKWDTLRTYGGKLIENIVQATARDVMAHNMPVIDYVMPIVLTVHDEVICEADEGTVIPSDLEQMMTALPPWADGLPLGAEAWEGPRYRK
jgi:DNA polymerase